MRLDYLNPIATAEQRENMTRKQRAMQLIAIFVVMCLVAVVAFFLANKGNDATNSAPVVATQVAPAAFVAPAAASKDCYVQHNVDHNCYITKLRYKHHAAKFPKGKYGHAKSGFHPTKWLKHPHRARAKFVSYVKRHPHSVPKRMRGSKAANAAWLHAIRHASCVWPSHYPSWYNMPKESIACTGQYATGGTLITKMNWTVIGFTICEGALAFAMGGKDMLMGRDGAKFDGLGFGVGSGPCIYGAANDADVRYMV